MTRITAFILVFVMMLTLLSGCAAPQSETADSSAEASAAEENGASPTPAAAERIPTMSDAYVNAVLMVENIAESGELQYVIEQEKAAIPDILEPEAPGTAVEQNDRRVDGQFFQIAAGRRHIASGSQRKAAAQRTEPADRLQIFLRQARLLGQQGVIHIADHQNTRQWFFFHSSTSWRVSPPPALFCAETR